MAKGGLPPVVVVGGAGYVAGEALRLLAHHPALAVRALASRSGGGTVRQLFPHLAGTAVAEVPVVSVEELEPLVRREDALLLSAAPHGEGAVLLDRLLQAAAQAGTHLGVVDLSADFRFPDPARWEAIYGHPHPAPRRCAQFLCTLPEHWRGAPPDLVAHPGCFTTAVVLALYPLVAAGWCGESVFVSAVTGSSGSGRTPAQGTHHPERRSNLHAYSPLAHRHAPEMTSLLVAAGRAPRVEFVPHSGPLVRGIYATIRVPLPRPASAEEVAAVLAEFYRGSPFVEVTLAPPRLVEVVGTNRCRLGVAVQGEAAVLLSALDNLVKGAAGGAVQWLNRMVGLPEDTGLRLPGLGWY